MHDQKKILITGTSSGIGLGLANEFLSRGAEVWGISRREAEELAKYNIYKHLQLDLSSHDKVRKIIPEHLNSVRNIDLLVLNAGILGDIKWMSEIDVEGMKRVMEVNVWSNKVMLDTLFDMNIQIKQVVGMSSKAALRSTPGWGPYSMSKAGLNMLMNIYAREYPETHFSSFAPGLIDSEIQESIYNIKETDKYPTIKRLQEARYTEDMPDAVSAAPMLIEGFEKALGYESGSHVDVREM
ncbi:MAG: SDR family NAD(P)-dependent oxidoreductase [Bacteroidota bacterium]|nr:SDR family NAD(P)-dependent oxidoreductase [Bacteroidota bacterium]